MRKLPCFLRYLCPQSTVTWWVYGVLAGFKSSLIPQYCNPRSCSGYAKQQSTVWLPAYVLIQIHFLYSHNNIHIPRWCLTGFNRVVHRPIGSTQSEILGRAKMRFRHLWWTQTRSVVRWQYYSETHSQFLSVDATASSCTLVSYPDAQGKGFFG